MTLGKLTWLGTLMKPQKCEVFWIFLDRPVTRTRLAFWSAASRPTRRSSGVGPFAFSSSLLHFLAGSSRTKKKSKDFSSQPEAGAAVQHQQLVQVGMSGGEAQ